MKVLQANAWNGRLLKPLAELIIDENPDFVCLQEVSSLKEDYHSIFGSLEELMSILGEPYRYFFHSPVFSYRIMSEFGLFGNTILSKLPFEETNAIFTNLSFMEDFSFEKQTYNIRNMQHVVIKKGTKKLNLLDHHGHHLPDHKNGDSDTLRQMKQIGEYIDKLTGPVVLTGDFNLAPHSKSLEQLNHRLTNLSVKYRLRTTRTPLTHKTEVCDYIFVNNLVKVKKFYASDKTVSDHKALILEFDI